MTHHINLSTFNTSPDDGTPDRTDIPDCQPGTLTLSGYWAPDDDEDRMIEISGVLRQSNEPVTIVMTETDARQLRDDLTEWFDE